MRGEYNGVVVWDDAHQNWVLRVTGPVDTMTWSIMGRYPAPEKERQVHETRPLSLISTIAPEARLREPHFPTLLIQAAYAAAFHCIGLTSLKLVVDKTAADLAE